MSLYLPPIRHRHNLHPELLLIIIGLFLLLITMFLVSALNRTPQERFAPDSAIAAETMIDETPDDIDISGNPRQIKGSVAIATPYVIPQLTATVKTTPLEVSLTDLLNGPHTPGQYSEIPPGTQLLGVTVNNNTVTVDLSEEFAAGGGSTSMIGRVKELKQTINAIDRHYQLKIAINGKPVRYLGGEGLEIE